MEKLFYNDSTLTEFYSEIVEIKEIDNKFHITMDKTAFFPSGGGQFCDLGKIENNDVIDVYEELGTIYHVMEKKPVKIHKVKCIVNWNRRLDGMTQHLGQHILSGCFYSLYNANTLSFHLGNEISTVDIVGILDDEKIKKAEAMANEIINQNVPVETIIPSKKDLKKITLRRDLPKTDEQIRLIKIGDLDINACCGVHPKNTIDVRIIKIKKYEKYKGNTRIEFLAGNRAVNYLTEQSDCLNKICKYLSSNETDAIKGIQNINERLQDTLNKNKELEEIVSNYEIKSLIEYSEKVGNISVVKKIYENKNLKYVSKLATKISSHENTVVLFAVINNESANLIFSCSKLKGINMNTLLKDAITLIDGKGGGSDNFAQGGGKNNGNIQNTLDYAFMKISKIIE